MSMYAVVSSKSTDPLESSRDTTLMVTQARGKVLAQVSGGTFSSLSAKAADRLRSMGLDIIEFPNPYMLRVADHTIDIRRSKRLQNKLSVARRAGWTQFVVQLVAPPQPEWLQQLEAQGLRVAGRMGTYGFLLEGSAEDAIASNKSDFVAFMAPVQPTWRVSSSLDGAAGRVKYLSVTVSPSSATAMTVAHIKQLNGSIQTVWDEAHSPGQDQRVIVAELDADAIAGLAALPQTRWIEHIPPEFALEDERSAQVVAGNLNATAAPNTLPVVGYGAALTNLGFDGTGTIVAINDTGVDTNTTTAVQADLAGRVAFAPTSAGSGDTNGHGTHVATIAVGNAATGDTDPQGFSLGQGMAPGAQYGVLLNPSFTSLSVFSQTAAQNNADVMNCSWGVNNSGSSYSSRDAVIDQGIRDADSTTGGLQYLTVVFSSGNAGPGATSCTKETKNAILVGNAYNARPGESDPNSTTDTSDDIRGVNRSSSRGPANDSRILPTVIAPGTNVISARSTVDANAFTPGVQRPRTAYTDTNATNHTNHTPMTGTSMAAPHVTGLCALLTEWWRDRTGGTSPSPAMLKALIVNGAVDCNGGVDGGGGTIGNIPDNVQGWGRANLNNIVLTTPAVQRGPKIFIDQRHAFTANNQLFTLRVAPVDTNIPLRITLVWTDAPSSPANGGGLVNDLDLTVTEIDTADLYRGNQFANGFSTTGGVRDSVNNVECAYVQNPSGEYVVTVRATSLTADARPPYSTVPWQDFALVIDNAERAASAPVDVVTCIDRSGSMSANGYVDTTRSTARSFVDRLRIGDSIGIVSFGSTAAVVHDDAGSVAAVGGAADRAAARAAIDAIPFGGNTHMGAGLTAAAGLLASSTAARGIVLMSDGYDNGTPSAVAAVAGLPSNLPVYTAAMGPLSDQALLEQIASSTGGQYYYMPTINDLFEIHNYLSSSLTGDSLVTNVSAMASSSRVGAWIDSSTQAVRFQVNWADTGLNFVADAAKRDHQICVRLRAPSGKVVHANAAWVHRSVGKGHVIFHIEEPTPGRWWMEVSTARQEHTRYTAAAFVESNLRLILHPSVTRLNVGVAGRAMSSVTWNGQAVQAVRIQGTLTQPTFNARSVLRKYSDLASRASARAGTPIDTVRLGEIRTALLSRGAADPLTYQTSHLNFSKAPSLRHHLSAAPQSMLSQPFSRSVVSPTSAARSSALVARVIAREEGSLNVQVKAQGLVPGTNDPFVRVGMLSVVAG